VSHGDVLVMGGTSDARAICQQLDAAGVRYTLSVATPTGQQLAGDIRGGALRAWTAADDRLAEG
jgi:precorrin-6A/cobalt-precorrin-6A reductase